MSNTDVNPAASASTEPLRAAPVRRAEHDESPFTLLIEQQTAKVPSHVFLFASMLAMGSSLALEVAGRTRASRFVGMWSPTLLIMGVYNKLVKAGGPR